MRIIWTAVIIIVLLIGVWFCYLAATYLPAVLTIWDS